MITFKARKTVNRWSRKLTLAFVLAMILIMTPFLMGMGGTDSGIKDPPIDEPFTKPILLAKSSIKDSDGIIRKTNRSLIDHAISRLGTGYVYGTYGQVLSETLLTAKLKQYPLRVSPYLSYIRDNWLGKPVQDCVGLIKGCYWTNDDGKIVSNLDKLPDVSANGLYNAAGVKGPITTLPEIKGIIVWKNGHVGIYIGNGEVIEAHGTKDGVIKTRLTENINDTKWTNWFMCPYIDYVVESNGSVVSIETGDSIDTTAYTVRSGDTLWDIASESLGKGILFMDIAGLNSIKDPDIIFPGQILAIPRK